MKRQSGPFMTIIFACAAALAAMIAPLPATQAQSQPIRLVALGDSLSAGYGLPQEAAFPVVLERALKAKGYKVEVANAGVSGDTTSGGLDRLDWSVPDGTDGVILELGANDMLRGLDPALARKNLEAIVEQLKSRNIPVMLAGMYASRNLGPDYVQKFDSVYPDIAKKHDLVLYPFFLDGVAGERSLNLPDGLHPTAKGVEIIVERILPTVESFLARLAQR
ncbi:acyl-CoA thioesterase-1 [Microvirga lupini]|uniref:Acyl-CoA thioesterase-1 n=1 Tax=Microvirga lupini TaxID=420324 RepID=A0A7W4VQT8_9HYPH|nr:arylesterase [Microvirga lupini]MBB3021242.1 acyl-CoA thioesterase-1 [Microvirga lupini]